LKQRVALVYPPFGPAALPSLGLGLLSAGLKARGIECRTFYWNFDWIGRMPGSDMARKLNAYRGFSGRTWYPFSEWLFARPLYGDALNEREPITRQRLRDRAVEQSASPVRIRHILALRDSAPEFLDAMVERLDAFDVIGIASTFFQNLPALALAKRLKEKWPQKTVVLGGANCDGEMGGMLLQLFPFINAVFSGESDHAFPEYVAARGDQRLYESKPLEDLESLPLPDFDDFISERERCGLHQDVVLALESSRGCWWGEHQHCTFCGLNANGMGYRRKSPERFRWEVEEMTKRYGARYFFLADNILPMEYHHHLPQWTRDENLHFFYEIKANVKRRHMENMASAGITAVQPGIEHFSSKVLQQMRKGVTGIQNIALLKYARECGVMATYNILTAFPNEDRDEYATMVAQLPLLSHLRPPSAMAQVEYHRFSPYHSTPESFGLKLRPAEHYHDLYPFGREVIERLAYFFESEEKPADLRYLKPLYQQLVAWAKAYDEDCCSLVWREEGNEIVVDDQRPGFGPKQHRLMDDSAALWLQLQEPQGLQSLVRAGTWDQQWVRQRLAEWVSDGLVYTENPAALGTFPNGAAMFLALAVREPRKPVEKGWLTLGL